MQLLKDVHLDEVNKIGTISSWTQETNVAYFSSTEPDSFSEAMKQKELHKSMLSEYNSVLENGTWKLVDCPSNVKPIGCKWVYRIKYKSNGEVHKYKARLVAKGFSQQEGIDYDETFAPITKWNAIRIVINLAAQNGWKLHQMDVKSVFLNGDLKEEVFMTQPQGFEVEGK